MYKECRIVLQILMGVLGCGKERPFFFFFFFKFNFFLKNILFCVLPLWFLHFA